MITKYNSLRPNGFLMTVKTFQDVSFTCQSVSLPSLTLGNAIQSTPFIDLPRSGDKLQKGLLSASFIVNEDMSNYLEIYNWLIRAGFPNSYEEFIDITTERKQIFSVRDDEDSLYSDIVINILNSDNEPNLEFVYTNCLPVSLSQVNLDVRPATDIEYITCQVDFSFHFYKVNRL
jgi:hypothetical protein